MLYLDAAVHAPACPSSRSGSKPKSSCTAINEAQQERAKRQAYVPQGTSRAAAAGQRHMPVACLHRIDLHGVTTETYNKTTVVGPAEQPGRSQKDSCVYNRRQETQGAQPRGDCCGPCKVSLCYKSRGKTWNETRPMLDGRCT